MDTTITKEETDSKKAEESGSDLAGETNQDPDDSKGQIYRKPDDDSTIDAGPPDGGAAAWLVVLGAWCCSFSSPGWINSKYLLSSLPSGFLGCHYMASNLQQVTRCANSNTFLQVWVVFNSTTRWDL